MLKTKYYKIEIDNACQDIFLIRVRKDFYTEGYSLDQDKYIQGYFNLYNNIEWNLYNNLEQNSIYYHNGIYGYVDKGLSNVIYDEYFSYYANNKLYNFKIDELTDISLIKVINGQLKNIRYNLNDQNKKIYDYYSNNRIFHYEILKDYLLNTYVSNVKLIDTLQDFNYNDLEEIKTYLNNIEIIKDNRKKLLKKD